MTAHVPRVGFVLHVMQVAGAEMLVVDTIRRLRGRIEPVIFCLDDVGPLGEQMRAEGVPVEAFHRRPGIDLALAWRMAASIRAAALDVIHAHQYTPFFYTALAARLSGVKPRVIFTEHGRHYPDIVSPKRRWLNRLVFDRLADEVNAVCEFSARSLSEQDGFRRARIRVIENGVRLPPPAPPVDRSTLLPLLGCDLARRYIANVARFHPVKDHRTLLHAFAAVAAARADVDLLLVGDGVLRPQLETLVRELGLSERVRFMGVRADVINILRAVDVFTLTSVSEAASITLLEAMSCETPVIVTRVGGNPEIVRDGIDGLLAPRGDAAAIASAMLTLLDDPAAARRMGASAAQRVRDLYRLERTVDRYYELYTSHAA